MKEVIHGISQGDEALQSISPVICKNHWQCDEFHIHVQISKNEGEVRAHFLQKCECYMGENTSADSQMFNFSKMERIIISSCNAANSWTGHLML